MSGVNRAPAIADTIQLMTSPRGQPGRRPPRRPHLLNLRKHHPCLLQTSGRSGERSKR